MDNSQFILAAASIAGGMAAAHYDKFAGLSASRVTEIAETAVKIARAIEIEASRRPEHDESAPHRRCAANAVVAARRERIARMRLPKS